MKLSNLDIKIIVGFRDDQYYTIPAEEAHKAYYLFQNPNARTVFSNGVALRGQDIMGIEPDYHSTMGWNPTHRLDGDDWNELNGKGISGALRDVLYDAKQVSMRIENNKELLQLPMSEARDQLLLTE